MWSRRLPAFVTEAQLTVVLGTSAEWTVRTLFLAAADDEHEVRSRIEAALRGGEGWEVIRLSEREVAPGDGPG